MYTRHYLRLELIYVNGKFIELRKQYATFIYDGYHIAETDSFIELTFDFVIDGLCEFHPTTKIMTDNLNLVNPCRGGMADRIIFALGMVEAVSYWKCACPPNLIIKCGHLDGEQIGWWKKLWFNGLSELFYRNGIETTVDDFVNITSTMGAEPAPCSVKSNGMIIVPIGGGKDSNVTLELLGDRHDKVMGFTVNDQEARTRSAELSGIGTDRIIKTYRTIDGELLKRNAEGFINGHTPFSAIVAFLSAYCAYLIGADNIVLSNEASANEANIQGTEINHQYSKSYEFECDFNSYIKNFIGFDVNYFSLLRPFNELQIAKQFAQYKKYHAVFRSCNAGSKKNVWCCSCAKCLFVYIILSPFLSEDELTDIFGCNLLNKSELQADFDGLAGLSSVKPFECIGTVDEVCAALNMTTDRYRQSGKPLPVLLKRYADTAHNSINGNLLAAFNNENNIPTDFAVYAERMYQYVSTAQ